MLLAGVVWLLCEALVWRKRPAPPVREFRDCELGDWVLGGWEGNVEADAAEQRFASICKVLPAACPNAAVGSTDHCADRAVCNAPCGDLYDRRVAAERV